MFNRTMNYVQDKVVLQIMTLKKKNEIRMNVNEKQIRKKDKNKYFIHKTLK